MEKIYVNTFPPLLTEIPDKPLFLYKEGSLPTVGNKLLAVVGSRKYTDYGKRVCEKLIADLAGFPITIVSGLALGIDSIAHRAALHAGLQTIAIPGSGLDPKCIYPQSHAALARDIVKADGGLLSEFEPKIPGYPSNFPQRNRIIAGMSHATLVIEAIKKSGTLITARLAMDYNRDVLTVPGDIFRTTSEGPNLLIKDGATPILSATDILEALHIPIEEKQLQLDRYLECTDNEKCLIALLETACKRDDLIRASEMSITDANTTLSILEIKGLIKESLGKIYLT